MKLSSMPRFIEHQRIENREQQQLMTEHYWHIVIQMVFVLHEQTIITATKNIRIEINY